MIKNYFFLISLLSLTLQTFGQDTTYFDSKWKVTNADNASFYRIDKKTDNGFEMSSCPRTTEHEVAQFTKTLLSLWIAVVP